MDLGLVASELCVCVCVKGGGLTKMLVLGSRFTQEKYQGVRLGKCPFQQKSLVIGKLERMAGKRCGGGTERRPFPQWASSCQRSFPALAPTLFFHCNKQVLSPRKEGLCAVSHPDATLKVLEQGQV